MSKWWQELQNVKSWLALIPGLYLVFILLTIVLAEEERTYFYYNEVGFFPLVIMVTVLFYQREIGGVNMELVATFPISFTTMWLRKWIYIFLTLFLAHRLTIAVFVYQFGRVKDFYFPYDGDKVEVVAITPFQLLLQSAPAALCIAALTLLALMIGKKTYVGLLAGFSLFMVDLLSSGKILGSFTLFTLYLPKETPFVENRMWLGACALLFAFISLRLIRKRSFWLVQEEEE